MGTLSIEFFHLSLGASVVVIILRGCDVHGCGHFDAPRGDHTHRGCDIAAPANARVYPQQEGTVTKLGYAYSTPGKTHLRYVQITDITGNAHRYFYVAPKVEIGDTVQLDTCVGIVQDLTKIYEGIINHVHYEIIDHTGVHLDPQPWLVK